MAILALSKNNKNQYRKYPFKQSATCTSDDGFVLSDKVIVNCSITSIYNLHQIYVKQIYFRDGIARIAIAALFDDVVLGVFEGAVNEDFTTLKLTPLRRNVSGVLTIGSLAELNNITRILHFEKNATELEESTIFCYTPPAVTSIRDKKHNELRGNVTYGILSNLVKSKNSSLKASLFRAEDPKTVFNLADKSTRLFNCPNPIINTINGVAPYPIGINPEANDGNIYIFGVLPIKFYGVPSADPELSSSAYEDGILGVSTENITLNSLCTQRNTTLPPTPDRMYFTSLVNTSLPGTDGLSSGMIHVKGNLQSTSELPQTAVIGDGYTVGIDLWVANANSPTSLAGWTNVGSFINQYYTKPALDELQADPATGIPFDQPARRAGNFYTAQKPEFYFWPQFIKEENYNYWPTDNTQ